MAEPVTPHLARAQAHGVWMTDAQARVCQANAAAARMRRGAAIDMHQGGLCVAAPAAQDAWLHHLVASTRGRHDLVRSFGMPSAMGRLQFTVLQLHVSHPLTRIVSQPLALLVVTLPARPVSPRPTFWSRC